jgi:hypothetical protein
MHFKDPNANNETVRRAADGTLATILGREACLRGEPLPMDALIKENKKQMLDLSALRT